MKKFTIPFLVALSFILYSCSSTSTGTSSGKTISASATTTENFTLGKTIYESNCGKCHELPIVEKFNDEKWKSLVNWMAPKAKLTPQQADLVYFYVSNSN